MRKPPVGFLPRRRFEGILIPVGNCRLVAPFQEMRHHFAMHARAHEVAHGRLFAPYGSRPEGEIGVAQKRNGLISRSKTRLPCRTKRLEDEGRQVTPCPYAKPRDGYEWHDEDNRLLRNCASSPPWSWAPTLPHGACSLSNTV